MTLTASTNLLMSALHRRWLTSREMLSIQGMPTNVSFTHGTPCSSFALRHDQERRGLTFHPWPSRHAICAQAGNSMHTACSGLIILFVCTQIMMDPGLMSVHRFDFDRRHRLGILDGVALSVGGDGSVKDTRQLPQEEVEIDSRPKRRRVQ